jgi:hypothetical protein
MIPRFRVKGSIVWGALLASTVLAAVLFSAPPDTGQKDRWSLAAPNGLTFGLIKGYPDWEMVSAHYRTDIKEIHVILGNSAAVAALAQGAGENGRAFPEGVTLVKLGYSLHEDPYFAASIEPDVLQRVEYVTKDSARFQDTGGWGFARFVYDASANTFSAFGRDKSFAQPCFDCHKLAAERDFIFTAFARR